MLRTFVSPMVIKLEAVAVGVGVLLGSSVLVAVAVFPGKGVLVGVLLAVGGSVGV